MMTMIGSWLSVCNKNPMATDLSQYWEFKFFLFKNSLFPTPFHSNREGDIVIFSSNRRSNTIYVTNDNSDDFLGWPELIDPFMLWLYVDNEEICKMHKTDNADCAYVRRMPFPSFDIYFKITHLFIIQRSEVKDRAAVARRWNKIFIYIFNIFFNLNHQIRIDFKSYEFLK